MNSKKSTTKQWKLKNKNQSIRFTPALMRILDKRKNQSRRRKGTWRMIRKSKSSMRI